MSKFQSELEQGARIYRTFCDAYKLQFDGFGEPEDPTEPYAAEYATREKFKQIRSELEGALEVSKDKSNNELSLWTYKFRPDTFETLIMAIDLQLGLNHSNTEELSEAKRLFLSVVDRIEARSNAESTKSDAVEWRMWRVLSSGLLLSTYIQLGQVSSCFGEYAEAVEHFHKAEGLYVNYKVLDGNPVEVPPPYRSIDLFDEFRDGIAIVLDDLENRGRDKDQATPSVDSTKQSTNEQQRTVQFESNYVAALLNLARTYAKFDGRVRESESESESNSNLAAKYCQLTLSKQLEISRRFSIAYDRCEWAMNAATLSQFYCSSLHFRTAKYLLNCASAQLLIAASDNTADDLEKRERAAKCEADLARCWVKFGLSLLERSWNVLRSLSPDADHVLQSDADAAFCSEQEPAIRFDCEGELDSQAADTIEVRLIRTFDEAKRIFTFTSGKLAVAERQFKIDEQCTLHCECVQDRSALLRALSNFVSDDSTRAKLTKRRVKLIRPLLCDHGLNATHYLLLFRELSYELADSYGTLVEFARAKLDRLAAAEATHRSGSAVEKVAKKLNTNVRCAIYFFTQFVRTYEAPEPLIPASPESGSERQRWNIPDSEWRNFLLANVRLAQLHTKLVGGEPRESVRRALETYRLVLSFADANPRAREAIAGEYNVCAEMASLLPAKLDKLSSTSAV